MLTSRRRVAKQRSEGESYYRYMMADASDQRGSGEFEHVVVRSIKKAHVWQTVRHANELINRCIDRFDGDVNFDSDDVQQ